MCYSFLNSFQMQLRRALEKVERKDSAEIPMINFQWTWEGLHSFARFKGLPHLWNLCSGSRRRDIKDRQTGHWIYMKFSSAFQSFRLILPAQCCTAPRSSFGFVNFAHHSLEQSAHHRVAMVSSLRPKADQVLRSTFSEDIFSHWKAVFPKQVSLLLCY